MPQLSNRSIKFATAVILAIGVCACGGGGGSSGNQAPAAAGDMVRADGADLDSIDVLANDSDPDGDDLTVSIEEAPSVGTATVNADGTIGLAALPSGFKGLSQFKYRVSDPDGLSDVASAAVFIGADPFRVAFAADEPGDGSTEVYLADFISQPSAVTAATEGNMRLRGFVISDNGATVVYRRQDTTAPAATDLFFVRTDDPASQVPIEFPNGATPLLNAHGKDQFRVSPDGQWIAAIARNSNAAVLYVVNISDPTTVTRVSPQGAVNVALPRFSLDSRSLYFLASDTPGGAGKSLFTVALDDPGTAAQISAPIPSGSSEDVVEYSVAPDQSRILLQAKRGGVVGLYFVDPSHLQTEILVSHRLAPGESILDTTVGLAPGNGGSVSGTRVAYTTEFLLTINAFVAEVSATPDPRRVGTSGARIIGFRPDDDALLYSRNGRVFEAAVDSSAADQLVGDGSFAWYDSTGNIVLVEELLPSGGSPPSYPALAVAARGSFGTTQALGTSSMAAQYVDTSGFDRGIAIIGEGPTTGTAPSTVRLALVNALAPDALLYLAEFESPLRLTSDIAQVVAN